MLQPGHRQRRAPGPAVPLRGDRGLPVAYGLYSAFAVLALLFVLRFVPDTKGRELQTM
ncbi:hypothetical protein [Micromonospora globispora]|uniref:hypothetical protein n=1 Tax=Micromonospora globispora TaxID=1450148 RepID=UPI001403C080|nr:hypothetical protein [Micromonospora globispora]